MVISVSGKIGSGKDTVGAIIQYLTASDKSSSCLEKLSAGLPINRTHNSTFKIKKFADNLKAMTCLLIGCTRHQLEDHSFKNKELGEEWWYYGFDGGLKIPYLTAGYDKGEEPLQYLIKPTPRLFLQLLGTECGREIIHPSIWVNALFAEYKTAYTQHPYIEYVEHKAYPDWIITDTRFPNELKAVKDKRGITILVQKPCSECGVTCSHTATCSKKGIIPHTSETALDSADFDYYISNDGTIEELIEKVKQILIKERII